MKRLFVLFTFLLIGSVVILAQGDVPVIPDWSYLYENFGVLMMTYLGLAAIASFFGEIVIRLIKATKKLLKVIIVMVLAVGLALLGSLINIGFLAEASWWQASLWGLLAGAAANGLNSGNLLFFKSVIEFLIGLILSKEPSE